MILLVAASMMNLSATEGALPGQFSVSYDKKVYFSKGNLQVWHVGNTQITEWRFAANQYDTLGASIFDYAVWVETGRWQDDYFSKDAGWDLFGWGTSGAWFDPYSDDNIEPKESNCWFPWNTSIKNADYGSSNEDIAGTSRDWGVYNKIANGGNEAGLWRTPTKSEWQYLLCERPNAARLLSYGTVNGVPGLIVLPDNWETPSEVQFTNSSYFVKRGDIYENRGYSFNKDKNINIYSTNIYSGTEWATMENAGAVFLPAAGVREGEELWMDGDYNVGALGYYWSSSCYDRYQAYLLRFTNEVLRSSMEYQKYVGCSVRLIQDVEEVSTAIDEVPTNNVQCTKLLRDGQILIQRGEKTYTLQGQEVK